MLVIFAISFSPRLPLYPIRVTNTRSLRMNFEFIGDTHAREEIDKNKSIIWGE